MIETKFKDWHNVTIGNLGSTYNGLTGKKASDFGHGVAKYVPFINVIYNPIIDVNSLCCVDVKPSEYQNAVIKGDLLFNTSSETPEEVAMCSYVDTDIQNLYLNSFCFGFRLNDSNVSGLFLSYLFRSKFGRSLMLELAQGSTRYNLQKKKFLQTELHIPQILAEQERIAEALSDVDALIKELDALIEKKRMVLKATMQDLLTARRRLPGFSEPWQEVKLGDVSTIFRGGSPRPIEKYLTQSVNGYNWIKIGDVKIGEKYITKTQERIIPQGINYTRLVNPGDFILSNSMSFGRPYILKICGCIHDGWLAISEYSNYFDTEYLYYLLGSDLTYKQYCTLAAGSGVLNLNKALVSCIILRAPRNLSEQRAIAEVLSDIDSEIAELEKKKEKYTSIRQGMMQQLLTGKIRLI